MILARTVVDVRSSTVSCVERAASPSSAELNSSTGLYCILCFADKFFPMKSNVFRRDLAVFPSALLAFAVSTGFLFDFDLRDVFESPR